MTTYLIALDAISSSEGHDQITYCDDTPENREILEAGCDDYVDAGEVIEYWRDAEDDETGTRMKWRVHIRASEDIPEPTIEQIDRGLLRKGLKRVAE